MEAFIHKLPTCLKCGMKIRHRSKRCGRSAKKRRLSKPNAKHAHGLCESCESARPMLMDSFVASYNTNYIRKYTMQLKCHNCQGDYYGSFECANTDCKTFYEKFECDNDIEDLYDKYRALMGGIRNEEFPNEALRHIQI